MMTMLWLLLYDRDDVDLLSFISSRADCLTVCLTLMLISPMVESMTRSLKFSQPLFDFSLIW